MPLPFDILALLGTLLIAAFAVALAIRGYDWAKDAIAYRRAKQGSKR